MNIRIGYGYQTMLPADYNSNSPWIVDGGYDKLWYTVTLEHLRKEGLHATVVIVTLLLQLEAI